MHEEIQQRNVSSWEEFEEQLKELRHQANSSEGAASPLWFRGQENSCWALTTTLERSNEERMLFKDYYLLIHRIRPQVESFTGNQWLIPEYEEVARAVQDYDFLRLHLGGWPAYPYMAYLRHHGFPSPLLDWTRSSRVAAYFAFSKAADDEKKVSIFVLSEETFTSRTSGVPLIFRLGPYVRTHRKHFLQQSDYTMCVSFENEWRFDQYQKVFERRNHHQGIFWKFNIPSTERLKVLRLLDEYNLNELSLFESEEALMKTMALRELHFRAEASNRR